MKLSFAWLCDHLNAPTNSIDPTRAVQLLNKSTAEVESLRTHRFPVSETYAGCITAQDTQICTVLVPENGSTFKIPLRSDATTDTNSHFLVRQTAQGARWATLADFGLDKEGLLPAFHLTSAQAAGTWREAFAPQMVLDIENKTITHRPDLWCHRGVGRELAALFNVPLRDEKEFLTPLPLATGLDQAQGDGFTISVQDASLCKKFAALRCSAIKQQASDPFIAARLLAIGCRPISAWVDLTNYVMYDWSHPMHAYDLDLIKDHNLTVRRAHQGEELTLLRNVVIQLTPDDVVVADRQHAVSLGGIKGGNDASLQPTTTNLLLEVATFHPTSVRQSAQRHKLRTDAAIRYEKTIDPELAVQTVMRFVHLLKSQNLQANIQGPIAVVGAPHTPTNITVSHARFQQLLGITISPQRIQEILQPLAFVVDAQEIDGQTQYQIQVPSFRSSKDVTLPEDIAEEIIRFYGYDAITKVLPAFARSPYSLGSVIGIRAAKQYLAHHAQLHEQQNYAFFDDQFLAQIDCTVDSPVTLANPINEYYTRMASSLIPGLLKNALHNNLHREQVGFFEIGKTWHGTTEKLDEQETIAALVLDKRGTQNFYAGKQVILGLLRDFGIQSSAVAFVQEQNPAYGWCMPYQTASIHYQNKIIGYLTTLDTRVLHKMDMTTQTSGFAFELNGDLLFNQPRPELAYTPLCKFQETYIDLSMLVPRANTAHDIQQLLAKIDPLVRRVQLIDFFEKEEWTDVRSLTMRLWLGSDQGTLVKADIDAVWQKATDRLAAQQITLRQVS